MAIYRQIHISFWQDEFVLNLTPEEKYFYIYLMTNSKTSQCGVYQIPKKVMELETGYNRETIDKLLNRFIEYKKIEYNEETSEVNLVNWLKYNSSKSPKVISCIKKELDIIKFLPFKQYIIDSLSIDYEKTIGKNKNNNKNNKNKNNNKNNEITIENIIDVIQKEINPNINSFELQMIETWFNEWNNKEIILEAIKETALNKATSLKYTDTILRNWENQNVNSIENVNRIKANYSNFKGKKERVVETPSWMLKHQQQNKQQSDEEVNQEELKTLLNSF